MNLAIDRLLIGSVVDGAVGDDHVGCCVGQIQRREIAADETHIFEKGWDRGAGLLDHGNRPIHTDGCPFGTDPTCGTDHVLASTAAQIH